MEWRRWACSFVQGWLGQTAPLQYYALIGKAMGQIGIMQRNMLLLSSGLVRKTTQNSFIWSFFQAEERIQWRRHFHTWVAGKWMRNLHVQPQSSYMLTERFTKKRQTQQTHDTTRQEGEHTAHAHTHSRHLYSPWSRIFHTLKINSFRVNLGNVWRCRARIPSELWEL